jgi:lipopolysaccharide export system protein LptA
MKFLYLVGLVLFVDFALSAQTNSNSSMSGATAVTVVQTNSPMEIRATEIQCTNGFQFFMKSNVAVYLGDVRVDNPQMKLRCELLTVEAPKWTNGTYNRVIALTNVVIDWVDNNGTNHATSDKAVYTYVVTNLTDGQMQPHFETNSTVVLTGNPIVTDASGTFQGDPINFDRIKGVVSSPNMHKMLINPRTNSPSLFQTPGVQPSKTNSTAK